MDLTALLPRSTADATLRPLTHRDAVPYAAGTTDPDVRRFAHLPEPEYTPQRVGELIDTTIADGLRDGSLAVLALAARESDDFLGSVVLFDVTAATAEIGFWLVPGARGRGLGVDALHAGQHLGRDMGLSTLTARTMVDNVASQRVLDRAGFRVEDAPVEATVPSGGTARVQRYVVAL